MGAKIVVRNSKNEAVVKADVHVSWTGGFSRGSTDSQGVFDTQTSGTLRSVSVWGEEVWSIETTLKDNGQLRVTYK
jgi:hypothetical protein